MSVSILIGITIIIVLRGIITSWLITLVTIIYIILLISIIILIIIILIIIVVWIDQEWMKTNSWMNNTLWIDQEWMKTNRWIDQEWMKINNWMNNTKAILNRDQAIYKRVLTWAEREKGCYLPRTNLPLSITLPTVSILLVEID